MNVYQILTQLRAELEQIDQAIRALEDLDAPQKPASGYLNRPGKRTTGQKSPKLD